MHLSKSWNCSLNMVNFAVCKLYLNKVELEKSLFPVLMAIFQWLVFNKYLLSEWMHLWGSFVFQWCQIGQKWSRERVMHWSSPDPSFRSWGRWCETLGHGRRKRCSHSKVGFLRKSYSSASERYSGNTLLPTQYWSCKHCHLGFVWEGLLGHHKKRWPSQGNRGFWKWKRLSKVPIFSPKFLI